MQHRSETPTGNVGEGDGDEASRQPVWPSGTSSSLWRDLLPKASQPKLGKENRKDVRLGPELNNAHVFFPLSYVTNGGGVVQGNMLGPPSSPGPPPQAPTEAADQPLPRATDCLQLALWLGIQGPGSPGGLGGVCRPSGRPHGHRACAPGPHGHSEPRQGPALTPSLPAQARFNHAGAPFQMFDSAAFQQRNLLFKDSTIELVPIATHSYQAWLGPDYLHAMAGLLCDPDRLPSHLRWCVLSTPEIQKCGDMAVALSRKQLKPEIQCVSGESPQHCMEQIQAKEADVITLSGGNIYTAGQTYGLVPAAGESYQDDRKDTYHAVALVKRNSSYAFTIDELRGKRSCHSGYGMASGWDIPVGVLVQRGFIRPKGCDVLQAVSEFFSASCVPVNNAKDYPSRLCELCIGDDHGLNRCHGNSQERYYGYSGAFRCLAEGAGDVAFVKHSTVFENTDGHNPEAWAVSLKSEDYQLLCPNGARAEVTQFEACSLARVPAQAVMVHPDTNVFAVYGLLDRAQDLFGNDSNKNGFRMFDSSDYRGRDLLFRDSTARLVPVGERTTPAAWLGPDFVASLEGLRSLQCSGAARTAAPGRPLLLLLPLCLGSVLGGPALAQLGLGLP
ncbi:melanotransferrin-like [Gracilinanus agilis]|uniref:melanotransferrin-like n=1 Tax=Gracilinanus agilis TaxID=191870 RepID=UPI001CFC8876|nr:melanotransferrin-like [Gracilinanus agilis]